MKINVLLELVKQYDRVRTQHSELEKTKNELSTQIKACLGDKEDAPVDGYRVSYKYDSDKEITQFDQERFKIEEPKLYKKYVKVKTVTGSRRLVIAALE